MPLELLLELLVAVLQLLDRAGELAQRAFQPVEPHRQIAGIGMLRLRPAPVALLTRLRLFAAIEKIVEKITRAALRCASASGQQQHGNRGKRRSAR